MKRSLLPLAPMEARSVDDIPRGPDWQYEPKWDGFRCLAYRDGKQTYLQSKAEKPLARYFPEVVLALEDLAASHFLMDGELVVPVHGRLNFDQLLQRIHPAESRVRKLASEHPALFIAFDLLANEHGALLDRRLDERRRLLEDFARKYFPKDGRFRISPASTQLAQAKRWLKSAGKNLDGVIAKRRSSSYHAGLRDAMVKVKRVRSADCVVGGFRYGSHNSIVGSLLLGLYDDEGLLHHVGFTSNIKDSERAALTRKLERLVRPPGFTGQAPGGPSRWSTKRSTEWEPLQPRLVVEVAYDHFSGSRFRHGTTFLRWRPDKAARQCTFDQVRKQGGANLRSLSL